MKLTLAFHIFNKEASIDGVLRSWLDRLSGDHDVEIVCIFDDLADRSDIAARKTLDQYDYDARFLYTRNAWEMGANNLALAVASGDIIVFIQDDNWIYTPAWDNVIVQTANFPKMGAIGLLAGAVWKDTGIYTRVECDARHKGESFTTHNIPADAYPPGIWRVDFVTRPLAVCVETARALQGIDWAYWPMDWDETDFAWRLQLAGFVNVILPLDLLNTVGKLDTIKAARAEENFKRGREIFMSKHASSILQHRIGGHAEQLRRIYVSHDGKLAILED